MVVDTSLVEKWIKKLTFEQMAQQKSLPKIAFIVFAVIVIGVVGYFTLIREKSQKVLNTNKTIETKITYSGQWKQAQFPQSDYRHSVNIMLPTTWKFNCCGDTDSYSVHFIYPSSSDENLATNPHISVYDFALLGCPNGGYLDCSLDELKKVSPNQLITSLRNSLAQNGKLADFESMKTIGTIKLSNFTEDAIIYTGLSNTNQPVELYLIQSSKGVSGIVFQQPKSFDSNLKSEFLNRITVN